MTAAISIEEVSKHFRIVHGGASSLKEIVIGRNRTSVEEFWALRDVTAELPEGETIGLIGPNGSGKTTLLKIIAGILSPTSGRVKLRGRVASLLELGAGFHPDLTGRENVYINASILGLSRKEVDRIFDDIVAFSGLERFIDNQVKYYSSGMFVRLGFAVAINVDPAILLVDEVLAVGDEAFQARCLERVRDFQQQGRTIVYVSHALDQVRDLCSHALYLQDGRLEVAGRTGDAIREFRLALYGISETDVDGADTIGGGQVRITSVRWNGEERRALMIESGAPLQLEIDFQPGPDAETLTDPRVGFAVYDQLDHEIFGVDNYRADAPIDEIHGPATVTFDIDSVPLTTGKYKVTLGIGSNTGAVWAWQDHAYTIEVANTTALNGNVLFPVRASASAAGALRSASP